MTSSLDSFVALIRSNGVARKNRFEFVIPKLPSSIGKLSYSLSNIVLLCESVKFNSFNMQSSGVPYGSGPAIKTPYGLSEGGAGTLDVTFIVDGKMDILTLFDIWMLSVYDNVKHEVSFFNNIVTDLEVYHINPEDESRARGYKFIKAALKSYTPDSYSYSDNNTYQKLNVVFEYQNYDLIATPSAPSISTLPKSSNNTAAATSTTGALINQISNISNIPMLNQINSNGNVLSPITSLMPSSVTSSINKLQQEITGITKQYQQVQKTVDKATKAYNELKSTNFPEGLLK